MAQLGKPFLLKGNFITVCPFVRQIDIIKDMNEYKIARMLWKNSAPV
jgi:hypothetical protein